MCTHSTNVIFAVWRVHKGVAHVVLVPSLPKNPLHGLVVQNKIPGGGVKDGETSVAAGRREVKEETGLTMKLRYSPILRMRKSEGKCHVKEGYISPRGAYRGVLRTATMEDGDSVLYPPIEVPLDSALQIVFQTERNKFHLNLLLALRDYLEARGIPTTAPAPTK